MLAIVNMSAGLQPQTQSFVAMQHDSSDPDQNRRGRDVGRIGVFVPGSSQSRDHVERDLGTTPFALVHRIGEAVPDAPHDLVVERDPVLHGGIVHRPRRYRCARIPDRSDLLSAVTANLPSDREVDRTIWRLAVPALGALAIEPLYAMADTIIVGRLGTTELAGLAVAAQILTVLAALANFLAYATTQRLAHHRGAARADRAASVGVQALWVALVIGIIATVGLMLTARPLAVGLGARDETADVAETYLRIRSLGMVTVLVALAAHGILRGVRDMVTPLRIVAASAIGNVIIEIVMVFGFDWGVAGAAWSTVIAQWAAVIAYLAAIRPHVAGTPRRPDASEMRALLGAGGWLVVRVAALIAALTLGTAFAARSGDATLAAHQIASTLFMVTALGLDALAIPAQTLVAEQLGSGSTSGAHHVAGRVLRSAMRAGVVLGVVVMALAPLAPWMFSSDGDVRAQATRGVLALGVLLIPGAVAFALDGILIGAGRYRELSVDMVQALAVFAIASVPVILRPSLGLVGVWGALTIWMVARAWLTHRTWRLTDADTMTPAVTGTGL